MPNWCNNVLRLSHNNPAMIERAVKAFGESKLLHEFVPCPEDLLRDNVATYSPGPEGEAYERLRQENIAKHGYESWHDWRIVKWGTKWDIGSEYPPERHDANNVTFTFESAWSPPVEAYGTLEEQGFVVEAYYYEPGMCFCGSYEDGCANDISIDETSYEWAHANIPKNIDEMFGIADEFAQWDAENEDDE